MSSRLIWDCAACPELKVIREKLETRFGPGLSVLPSDPEWLIVQVSGLTDFALMQTLEREQQALFGPALPHLQVVCEQTGKERGVSIRYLTDASAISKAHTGFWFY